MLKIHNSLSGKKERFVPLEAGKVRMYVCGITVYDYLHLGHARMLIVFDMITRWLRASGYQLTYARNITDVDDKIIARANENGEDIDALTARFIDLMNEDCAALDVLPPTYEPRATETMDAIIVMIEALEANGYAYRGDNGDVYYAVAKFDGYGTLSGKIPADLRAGARVETDPNKRDPLDFVLWKAAKPDEPFWPSPWGDGRPGWHIECSAMATKILGNVFDIHGGGMDLKFPHHENEIAQSCAATGEDFAKLWMHNGFVRIDNEKMSKSLGNFFTVREIFKSYHPDEVRYFLLGAHYRQPINYSESELQAARAALTGYYSALAKVDLQAEDSPVVDEAYAQRFADSMNDDFNTPGAMAVLADLKRELNRSLKTGEQGRANSLGRELVRLAGIIGLLGLEPQAWLQRSAPDAAAGEELSDTEIESLIAKRKQARDDKDWAESDRIRDLLATAGVQLEDGPDGTTWKR
ncbi:MAG: cysteine--tRNA ligase [Gammaproteobacteria bacterium]|nr:cysteine--tRNA ligase [Gammaproteobacteria bacterium]